MMRQLSTKLGAVLFLLLIFCATTVLADLGKVSSSAAPETAVVVDVFKKVGDMRAHHNIGHMRSSNLVRRDNTVGSRQTHFMLIICFHRTRHNVKIGVQGAS